MPKRQILVLIIILFVPLLSKARTIRTNAVFVHNAPDWMKQTTLEKSIFRIQKKLEWRTRRIHVYYHDSKKSYQQVHNLGANTRAVSIKTPQKQEIHLSPFVNKDNYTTSFEHELVHIIFYQKYQGAIPVWLEEGFANYLSKRKAINYQWLAKQTLPKDIKKMGHPFAESASIASSLHYSVSQAVVEMLYEKCYMENLLRLSVMRKMKDYIKTYCKIEDINQTFKDWLIAKTN